MSSLQQQETLHVDEQTPSQTIRAGRSGEDELAAVAADDTFDTADEAGREPTRSTRIKAPSQRPVSSFGVPRTSPPQAIAHEFDDPQSAADRPSLYERLMKSGALTEVMQAEAFEKAATKIESPALVAPEVSEMREPEPVKRLADLAATLDLDDEQTTVRTSPITEPMAYDSDKTEVDLQNPLDEEPIDSIDEIGTIEAVEKTPRPARPPTTTSMLPIPPIPLTHSTRRSLTPASDEFLPSVLLGPGASLRYEQTERVVLPDPERLSIPLDSLGPALSVPVPHQPPSRRKTALAIGSLSAAAVALAVVLVPSLVRNGESSTATHALSQQSALGKVVEAEPALQPSPTTVVESAPATPALPVLPTPEPVAEPAPEPVAAAPVAPSAPASVKPVRRVREPVARETTPTAVAANEPAPAPEAAPVAPEPVTPAQPGVPDQLPRETVLETMNSAQGKVAACAAGMSGIADVTLTVRSTGKVSHAIVGGTFSGTPQGSCIARAVREIQFPPFVQPMLKVQYKFSL